MMAKLELSVSMERRRWFGAAFLALAVVCALASLISRPAADWIGRSGVSFLARHGIRYFVSTR